MLGGELRREGVRLGVEDEVDVALTVERHVLRAVLRHGREAHDLEQPVELAPDRDGRTRRTRSRRSPSGSRPRSRAAAASCGNGPMGSLLSGSAYTPAMASRSRSRYLQGNTPFGRAPMTVQDISAFESRGAPLRGSAIEPGYMSGFGNSFETEALPGALAGRPQLAAEGELRPLCRAALRLAVHRAAGDQPAHLALSHPPDGAAHRAASRRSTRASSAPRRRRDETDLPIGQLRWAPTPIPDESADLRHRPVAP